MVDPTHEPFIELVLHNDHLGSKDKEGNKGRRFARKDIEAFLDGDMKDEMLSICYEYWSYGDTGKVATLLGAKAVTDVHSNVDPAILEGKAKLEARVHNMTGVPAEHLEKVSAMKHITDSLSRKPKDPEEPKKDNK